MKSIDPKLVRMGRRSFESCVTIVDIQNENQAHPTIQAKCDLFIGSMQFSNENSCSLTTSLWCVLTLRRVFTVCRLDFIWFGYSLSMNCIHYTPRSSCTGNRHTQTRIRTHLRLLTMFVLGHVDSWMKLSRKENTPCVDKATTKATKRNTAKNTKVFKCIAFYSVARTLFAWCSSLMNTVLLCDGLVNTLCVATYAYTGNVLAFQLIEILRKSSCYL